VTLKPRWLVLCSCGWGRECVSEWAAESVSKLHKKLGAVGVEHTTHVDAPAAEGSSRGEQLPFV